MRGYRAVAKTVSRWLPTATARVRVLAACGVCGGQSGTGAGFLRVLRFPLSIKSTNFFIIIITRGWHNKPIGGRSAEWTQLDSTPPTKPIKENYEGLREMSSIGSSEDLARAKNLKRICFSKFKRWTNY
jgi:hypothetical protein